MEGVFSLVVMAIIALWVIAFVRMQKYGSRRGVSRFFLMLLLALLANGLAFVIIVVPVIDCHDGMFCGLGEILIFMALCALLLISFPIVMMTAMVAALKKSEKNGLRDRRREMEMEIID